jgi:hypothetical protein
VLPTRDQNRGGNARGRPEYRNLLFSEQRQSEPCGDEESNSYTNRSSQSHGPVGAVLVRHVEANLTLQC